MKRISLVLLLVLTTISQAFSQFTTKVDETSARHIAQAFVTSHQTFKSQDLNLISSQGNYIYNIGNQGFVIISSNTVLPPVLAWSDQGRFPSLEDAPENFASWIQHYSDMIDFAEANGIAPKARIQQQWDEAARGIFGSRDMQTVDPLVSTHWNQDCYYNEYCPETGGWWWESGPCGHAYAGCVACAMSQVMKYWDYPEHGYGSHSYVHPNYGTQSADFGSTTYQWSQMPNEIYNSNDAIATLMYHCGVSVDMNYAPNGSGAYSVDVDDAFRNYFGYCGAKYLSKGSYQEDRWIAMLKAELDLSHPIYYSGASDGGGHAFVCDGYDDDDLMHFNFGWSGSGDGFYSTYDVNGYNQGQAVVLHIYPIAIQADAHGIIYVTTDGLGDGSSWDYATNKLELACDFSNNTTGNMVWVKEGTYYGDVANPEGAFYITSGNRVYGGFEGDEAPDFDLSLRDFEKSPTILDGQGERRVLMQDQGFSSASMPLWDGFIIQNGAAGTGAGAYLNNYVTLNNCQIINNEASMFGGGVYVNSTGGTAHVDLKNCIIMDNSASMGGGVCDRIGANYANCRISNNTATTKGGGIYLYNNTEPTLKNCILSNNTAKNAGAMYARAQFTAYNCDIVMNLATESIGGIFHENAHNKYYNCILWGNIANGQPSQTEGASDYEYCAVQGSVSGNGNHALSPDNDGDEPGCFVRFNYLPEGAGAEYYDGNWSLQSRSICLNAGKPNTTGLGNTDIAGNPRIQKGRIDIGANESCASLTLIEDYMNEGEDYWFFDNLLTEPGYYTAVIEGEECDSVVGLTLMVLDGVTENDVNSVQVWPNPTNGIVHIEAGDINKVEVYNLLGQLALTAEKVETIDLSHLEKGVYFVKVKQNSKNLVTKIVKQ